MPDGLQLDSVYTDPATNPTRASRLIVRFDELYNVPVADRVANLTARPWFAEMQAFFDIVSSKTGITYVYVSDDGAANGSPGLLGARGDVRIGGTVLDGPLAYNATPPDGGDMVINTDGTTFASTGNLRVVFGHEHAHGLGLGHVTVAGSQSLSMVAGFGGNVNGPQTDDLQSLLRAYGDVREKSPGDGTAANARPLGALPSSTLLTVGTLATDLTVQAAETDFPFSSNSTDVDFFRFSVTSARRVAVKLSPQGPTYSYLPEGGTDTNINLSNQADLTLRLQNAGGTQLATSDLIGTGQTEGVAFDLPAAGDYFVRVGNKTAKGQFYRLDIGSIAAFQPAVADHYLADFNTAGDTEGWTASPDVSGFASTGGSLVGTATGNDPFISRQGLFFAGGARRVIFRFRSTGGTAGQFWWTTTNASGFAAERRVDFTYTGDSTWQTIVLDLSANPLWNGQMITGLRVDTSATSGAAFELDQLRVTNNFAYNGDFSVNAASFTGYPGYVGGSNPANPTGWTTTSIQVGVNGSSAPHGPFAPANSVPSFLFIQGGAPTASQPISTTSGSPYLFGFDAAARNGNTSGVNVFANDTQPASLVLNGFGGNNGWLSSTNFQRYAFGFTATGAQTIQFSGSGIGDHTTDITNVSVTDAVSSQLNIADGTLFFTETSGTHNYGFSLTGTNQTIYRRPGSATYTGNITTDGSAGALTLTANENDGANNLTFSGSSITLGAKSLNVTGDTVDSAPESLNSKVTLTNSTLTTAADVNVGRGSLEIIGSTSLTIGGQLRSGAGGDWSTFIMNPSTSVTTTGGVDFTANGVVAANLFLNGGTLTTPFIRGTSLGGNTNLIFNGTTVLASADSADFVQVRSNAPALIAGGGAIFDTNGKNITIQNPLANDGASQGTLTKQGVGSLTLAGDLTYVGNTTINGGTLKLVDKAPNSSGIIAIASGAAFDLNVSTTPVVLDNANIAFGKVGGTTINGTGTFIKSGAGVLALDGQFGNHAVTFNMTGGMIDIQGGTLRNGGWDGGIWTTNRASMNIASGARFDIWSGQSVTVDALTGGGLVDSSTYGGSQTLTVGINNGSGNFSGTFQNTTGNLGLIKAGTGTQTLTGVNTYTGDTTVTGGTLAVTGSSIADTNKLIINGGKVDLTGSETVNSLFFGGVQQAAGTYSADATNFTGSGTLVVTTGPAATFASWAATPAFGLAPGNQGATADPENDGMNNLLEYALNGNPSISDPSILPGLVVTATDFEFTYSRLDLSLADTVQTFQYGSDLSGWTSVLIPAGPGTSTVGVVTVTITNTAATDSVKISIPKSTAVGAKLFGRLRVNK